MTPAPGPSLVFGRDCAYRTGTVLRSNHSQPDHEPALIGREDPAFRGYDLRYREAERVQEWAREFVNYEKNGNLPGLEIMRLPNDHTAGTQPGRLTPQEYVAENDLAVGQVVDIVSHSSDWKSTAIFITEDDAQNGPDHVDAHRTTSLVVSPYTHDRRRSSTTPCTTRRQWCGRWGWSSA